MDDEIKIGLNVNGFESLAVALEHLKQSLQYDLYTDTVKYYDAWAAAWQQPLATPTPLPTRRAIALGGLPTEETR